MIQINAYLGSDGVALGHALMQLQQPCCTLLQKNSVQHSATGGA
jgi:hypothetical protein